MPRLFGYLAICISLIAWQNTLAAEPGKPPSGVRRVKPQRAVSPPIKPVQPVKTGLFEDMAGKRVMASFVPHDASVALVSLANVSSTPLEVSLPSVFAGAPVTTLANVQPGRSYNLVGTTSEYGPPQILGSVIPPSLISQSPSDGGMPAAPSMMLQPRQIRQFAVPCVCLQYGNPTPRPEVPYRLVSLDTVSQSPQLRALLDEFSLGRLSQPVTQLAAWHFSNNLSWDQLSETGFAPDGLGQAATLAALIETDVARKGTASLSDAAGQPKSDVTKPAAATSPPSKPLPRRGGRTSKVNKPSNPGNRT